VLSSSFGTIDNQPALYMDEAAAINTHVSILEDNLSQIENNDDP